MSDYIGSRKQVDEYIGSRLVVAGYQGSRKYFDAFDTVSGAPPLTFDSRVQQVLRNYAMYGSAGGAGSATSGSEPAGYKITLSLTSGEWLQDYDLFIGSSKLGEEEYVDYESGKVYKRTENIYNKDDHSTVFGPGYNLPTTTPYWNYYGGTAYTIRFPCRPSTVYTICLEEAPAIFRVATTKYDSIPQGQQIGENVPVTVIYYSTNERQYTFTTPNDAKFILFQGGFDTSGKLMILEGSTAPETYIPYYRPTDPPAPFPAISAYKGNNTISSAEQLSSISVCGRINV